MEPLNKYPIGTIVLFTDNDDFINYFAVGVVIAHHKATQYTDHVIHFADEQEPIYVSSFGVKEYADEWDKFFKKRKRK